MPTAGSMILEIAKFKKRFGITSYIELILIGITLYLCFAYVLSLIGLTPPMTSVIGVAALSFCCYQVYLLTALSERLEDYAKQNKALKETNVKLTQNVDTFMKQNADLKRITDELAQENGKFKGQVDNLGSTLKNLEVVSQTIEAFGAETQGDLSSILTNLKETLDGQKEVFFFFLFFFFLSFFFFFFFFFFFSFSFFFFFFFFLFSFFLLFFNLSDFYYYSFRL